MTNAIEGSMAYEDRAEPVVLYGATDIAELFGVTRATVSNWVKRHTDTPPPFAVTHRRNGEMRRMYTDDGLEEWKAWYESHVERTVK